MKYGAIAATPSTVDSGEVMLDDGLEVVSCLGPKLWPSTRNWHQLE